MTKKVIKRNGAKEDFSKRKIWRGMSNAFDAAGKSMDKKAYEKALEFIELESQTYTKEMPIGIIQDCIEDALSQTGNIDVARKYILYRNEHARIREFTKLKEDFINKYKGSYNTADATVDDNSNVSSKNIGVLNAEIHKPENIEINRRMMMNKLRELYPEFDAKEYIRDLHNHLIYKHDESSFAGAIAPYCCSISMYPFLTNGIKDLGGLSAAPKNLDSYCGMYVNLIFAVASQFAGAVATSEFLLYFDYFARKEWGDNYYLNSDAVTTTEICSRKKTIKSQIHQYFQQVIYTINQPVGLRGLQSAFVNFSYFDKPFFEGMFGDFYFPDGTKPVWESLCWLQKDFMMWLNNERLRTILTFPVESFALVYKDGKFVDQDAADFVAEEYGRGHSFFTYISDTVDSLSSCCRLKNMVTTKEFNFTNGNMGVQTGSKSVITLNLSRLIQNYVREKFISDKSVRKHPTDKVDIEDLNVQRELKEFMTPLLERVYKYHTAYNELLWDVYKANLLPVYKAGFIDLNKQYLTIGLNGLNQAAEFLSIKCDAKDKKYQTFCQFIFSTIKAMNKSHKTPKTTFNTEQVPAESLAIKNYNWDKKDGYWVPDDTNLYASYIFKPNDPNITILDKIKLHGKEYIGEYLDGGAAAHLNLEEHLSAEQYKKILKYAADNGCQYLTFNIKMTECLDCGNIVNRDVKECPKCGHTNLRYWTRIIGYLTAVNNWSEGRRLEYGTRVFEDASKEV